MTERLPNIHPGEILLEEFITPKGLKVEDIASRMNLSATRLNKIIAGAIKINKDLDFRLSHALGTSYGFWLGLQKDYDREENN